MLLDDAYTLSTFLVTRISSCQAWLTVMGLEAAIGHVIEYGPGILRGRDETRDYVDFFKIRAKDYHSSSILMGERRLLLLALL